MSKEAKITYAQTVGVMFATGVMVVIGWVLGFVQGITINMNGEENKTDV